MLRVNIYIIRGITSYSTATCQLHELVCPTITNGLAMPLLIALAICLCVIMVIIKHTETNLGAP